ncbi:hypothetical protein AYO39_00915 [Actinobacteria bacterium SCGC AG-212-D09]|nr:hypothetical protein AYO39_00915 [Actinobacteria bacterium SCGC AG-212-D09]
MAGEQLRVTDGAERGKLLSVAADLLIGREAPEEAGKLGLDPELSRRHALVSRAGDGRLTIEDLGSANGTFVNDQRVDAARTLEVGDVIRVGRTVLGVTDSSGAGEPSRAEAERPAAEPTVLNVGAGPVLVVTAGSAVGRQLTPGDELVIGREVSGPGKLGDDTELSRRHARIARAAGGELTIEDLGSANGTFLNGERVRGPQVLKVGDSVRVGSTVFQLTDGGRVTPSVPRAAPPAAAAPATPPSARAARPRAVQAPAPDRDRVALEVPLESVFAGCRVEEVIGHGDMGVVYRAEELALQRRVALKLILPEYSREERFRERFRRESRVAAAIDHPNVIPVFDAGEEDGVLYIMMRYVEGTDLGELIAARGRIEPLRAARIVRRVGAALDAAHARGLLHRDVKPSNVLLGREDHVYLSDFGLAKPAASTRALTRQGSIVARVEYVAPEQILNQQVDARADIYALGCLLFEALTGEPPFASSEEGPAALAHLDAPRPSPADLRPDVPREFDDVVRRAMATDPSDRYPSAGDLGEAALVAAGGLRRARQWSVVATGEAAPFQGERIAEPPARVAEPPAAAPRPPVAAAAPTGGPNLVRWAIPIAFLAIVFVGMLAALNGISTL